MRHSTGPSSSYDLRIHYVEGLLDGLRKLQSENRPRGATKNAERLMTTILEMSDHLPQDPYMDVVMALYDALAYDNSWATYTRDQYEAAHRLLTDRKSTRLNSS